VPTVSLTTLAALSAKDVLRDLGIAGLVALMVVESVFPPIPSEVVLPLAGYFVATGEFSFVVVLAAATFGSVVGAQVLYELARHGGRPFVRRWGLRVHVGPEELARAEEWFQRRGPIIVLAGRCIPGARSLVSLPAGVLKMPRPLYLTLTVVGSLAWNALLIGSGWLLGEEWEQVSELVGAVSTPLLGALLAAMAVIAVITWRRLRDRAQAARSAES
jgi:membrane protein DedA with SNARE-associated domain